MKSPDTSAHPSSIYKRNLGCYPSSKSDIRVPGSHPSSRPMAGVHMTRF